MRSLALAVLLLLAVATPADAVSGWYLLFPPGTTEGGQFLFDTHQPLLRWDPAHRGTKIITYDTERLCQMDRRAMIEQARRDRDLGTPGTWGHSTDSAFLEWKSATRCITSNDTRLDGQIPTVNKAAGWPVTNPADAWPGWLLLSPPVDNVSDYNFDASTPLPLWSKFNDSSPYATERLCQMARIDSIAKAQKFIVTAAAERYYRAAQCFSSDDPRIYSSAAPTGTRISSDDQRLYPPAAATTKPPKVAAAKPPGLTYTPVEPQQRLTITPDDVGIIRYTPGRPIVATVRLNGRASARLILDTGADGSMVKPELLAAAGVDLSRPTGRGEMVGIAGKAPVSYFAVTFEVAGHRVLVPQVAAFNTQANTESGFTDGLLGRDFLDRFKVTVSPASGTVTLVPR